MKLSHSRYWIAVLATLLPLATAPVHAVDTAVTPYAVLHGALAPAQAVTKFDRLLAVQKVESKLAGVRPVDIRIEVRARAGAIQVPVAANGDLRFPISNELLAENPDVVSNQPRGSLTLAVTVELKLPEAQRFAYAEIAAALRQAERMIAERAAGARVPRVAGADFQFAPGAGASISVQGRRERFLMADQVGRVVLIEDEELRRENPLIVLSQRPTAVLPYLQP